MSFMRQDTYTWIQGSHHSQIKIEAREIWPIEVRLHKVKYCFGIEFGSSTFWWFRFGFGIFLGSNFGNKLLCFLYMFWIFNSKKETTKIIHHWTLSHGTHFYFNFHVYVLFFIYNFYIWYVWHKMGIFSNLNEKQIFLKIGLKKIIFFIF